MRKHAIPAMVLALAISATAKADNDVGLLLADASPVVAVNDLALLTKADLTDSRAGAAAVETTDPTAGAVESRPAPKATDLEVAEAREIARQRAANAGVPTSIFSNPPATTQSAAACDCTAGQCDAQACATNQCANGQCHAPTSSAATSCSAGACGGEAYAPVKRGFFKKAKWKGRGGKRGGCPGC